MKSLLHWRYFLALEADIERLSRYVELTRANYRCYSIELMRTLFATAAEVDAVCKQLCAKLAGNSKADKMPAYRTEIFAAHQEIATALVAIPTLELEFYPWCEWQYKGSPDWWHAYNNIKHNRHLYFSSASLEHALEAVAGLLVLLLFFYRKEAEQGELFPHPGLFQPEHPFIAVPLMWGGRRAYLPKGDAE